MRITYIIFTWGLLLPLIACQSGHSGTQNSEPAHGQSSIISGKLSPEDFLAKLTEEGRAQLIDVRTPGEVAAGHIADAQNINIQDQDFQARIGKLDKNQPIFVYCAKGGRSGRAANQLKEMGFVEIYDLAGGYTEWSAKGMEK
ncbi:MAG: rhodanese-like domain-containing protein [Bacteroidota bacterium]